MEKVYVTFMLVLLFMGIALSAAGMPTASAASQTDISTAIQKGLAYLYTTQALDGHWGGGYPVACTAMAVLAFENQGHYGWNATDPYKDTVQNGLDWLFSVGLNITISNQTAGNPDSNGNGIGVAWYYDDYPTYESPMVLMAIVASQAPTNVTNPGPLGVRTYHDIAVDIVDYIAWAQNDPGTGYPEFRGGWGYSGNDESWADNSNSGWPVLGLMTAQLWGINAPAFVKSELNYWVAACQDLSGDPGSNSQYGSFLYSTGYGGYILGSIAEAASGINELDYLGASSTNASVIAAEGYINSMWYVNDGYWNVNIGNLYAMYDMMKACREATPTIAFLAEYNGSSGVEWYNGTGQYADSLIGNQGSDGSWVNWNYWAEAPGYPPELTTALGVLILEFVPVRVAYNLTVYVVDAGTGNPILGAAVLANGPETHSGNTGGSGKIDFGSVQAGNYLINASAAGYPPSTPQTVAVTGDTNFTIRLEGALSPRGLKNDAVAELRSAEQLSGQFWLVKEIDAAIFCIQKSLTSSFWVDDFHLNLKNGHSVFDWEVGALLQLTPIPISTQADTNTKSVVQAVINKLLNADKTLANKAIQEAKGLQSTNPTILSYIKKASDYFDMANKSSCTVFTPEMYETAWQNAEAALFHGTP